MGVCVCDQDRACICLCVCVCVCDHACICADACLHVYMRVYMIVLAKFWNKIRLYIYIYI